MLRTRFMVLACLAVLGIGPAKSNDIKFEAPREADKILNAEVTAKQALDLKAAIAELKAEATPDAQSKSNDKPAEPGAASKPADAAAAEPAKPAPAPEPTLTAAIDLTAQKITVSEYGEAKYTWAISSGTAEHPTPRGTFRPQWTAKMWYSKKYDNAPMPHAVFIHDGVAIHATYATGMLGRPASHGCIRLSPANAATFYRLVGKHGTKMTKVSVFGTPKWRAPAVASRGDDGDYRPRRAAQYQQPYQQQQYQQKNTLASWFFDTPKYRPPAAYSGYPTQVYRRPPPPPGYRYADQVPVRAYRPTSAPRGYYVQPQRAPRRVYYTNRYSSGW